MAGWRANSMRLPAMGPVQATSIMKNSWAPRLTSSSTFLPISCWPSGERGVMTVTSASASPIFSPAASGPRNTCR
ncbi:hypothetical protein D3C76_1755440 [compost metagenome]